MCLLVELSRLFVGFMLDISTVGSFFSATKITRGQKNVPDVHLNKNEYPLVIFHVAMEAMAHRNSGFSQFKAW